MFVIQIRFGEADDHSNSQSGGLPKFGRARRNEGGAGDLRGLPPLNKDHETAATELEVQQAIYEKAPRSLHAGINCMPVL
jgi:hypothetical protein